MIDMSAFFDVLLIIAIVSNGLLAGLFFVFVCAISPGFQRVDDTSYVRAFRALNRAILNGWFLSVFFLAPLVTIGYAVLGTLQNRDQPLWLWIGALGATLTFLITVARNVPLNTRLDQATVGDESQCRVAREGFEEKWNRWNFLRTITSLGALVGLAIAAVG